MSSYAVSSGALPRQTSHTGLYAEDRRGSGWQQIGVAIVAIVLAVLLVVGQIALAATHDIQQRLHHSVTNLSDGNTTMAQVIARAAPNRVLLPKIQQQKKVLTDTSATMISLNDSMRQILGVTTQLGTTVDGMRTSSATLSTGVAGMAKDASSIATLIGPLPRTASSIGTGMKRIDGDSAAINSQLGAIDGKLLGYGLPQARESR